MDVLLALWAFGLMVALDYAWGRYTRALSGRPVAAANWALFLFLIGATVTETYISHRWTLIPAALGAWLGTWLAARRLDG